VTGLREALAGYLDLRRGLGFKLERDAKLLDQFIACLEQREARPPRLRLFFDITTVSYPALGRAGANGCG
jgi:hypothetical protein